MKIPYKKINQALSAQFEGVDLRPDPLGNHAYVLHFEDDDVSEATMERAMDIVNLILPSEWYRNEMRHIDGERQQ